VHNNVLRITRQQAVEPGTAVSLDRDTLNRVTTGVTGFSEALADGQISVTGDRETAELLAGLIE